MKTAYCRWALKCFLWCLLVVLVGNRQVWAGERQEGEKPLIPHTSTSIHYSTPPGIVLIDITQVMVYYTVRTLWTHLGDARGHSLFTYDGDGSNKSNCVGECVEQFPPLIADEGAVAMGNWSLVNRDDGSQQWAYQGRPLYRFARETSINEVANNLAAAELYSENADKIDEYRAKHPDGPLLPPQGWRLARYQPGVTVDKPVGVGVVNVPRASSVVFVTRDDKTLYTFDGATDEAESCQGLCQRKWIPLAAAQLARSVGRFTIVQRTDGTRQWAYDGKPLFSYHGDLETGQIKGLDYAKEKDDERWSLATLVSHFQPAGVIVRKEPSHGDILSTDKGKALYLRNTHEGFFRQDVTYQKGKRLGLSGCDAECLKTWHPLAATADARPQGYWEPVDRPDGTRQWAYKGSVLYFNREDKPNGPAQSDNVYDFTVGDRGRYRVDDIARINAIDGKAPGFFWRVREL